MCRKWLNGMFNATLISCGVLLVVNSVAGSAWARFGAPPVPEIDPASMGSALTLLIGGLLVATGRCRK
jgi:hypothetical protein